MNSSVVVKVKYGETLRRFNAFIVNNELDLDMNGLRGKVLSLFNFPSDSELVLTYIDEDGDVVTLADEEDLRDIVRQSLNPLRISVRLNTERIGRSHSRSSGDSTPLQSPKLPPPFPNVNANVSEIVKSVPEAIRETLSRLSTELGSNSTSSPPVYTELLDSLSKIGLTYLKEVAVSSPKNVSSGSSTDHPASDGKNSSKVDDRPITELRSNEVDQGNLIGICKDFVNPAADFVEKPIVELFGEYSPEELRYGSIAQGDKVATNNRTDGKMKNVKKLNSVGAGFSRMKDYRNPILDYLVSDKSGIIGAKNNMVDYGNTLESEFAHSFYQDCPFTGTPIENYSSTAHGRAYSPRVVPFKRSHSDGIKSIFHRGIRCDGCGVHPITGPRYKSKVKEDYDLCNVCFADMGNDAEYIRMDHPMSYRHPTSLKGFYNPHCQGRPPTLPQVLRGSARVSKLDSRFIQDVSIRDGTFMAPSTPFTKIWRLRNDGNTAWPQGTQLLWIGGDRLSETLSIELQIPADGWPVDKEIDIAVEFKAPECHGRFISYWRMASPSGQKFGQRVWVLIQVDDSLKDSFTDNVHDFNLNFPPFSDGVIDSQVETSSVPIVNGGLPELDNSNKSTELVEPASDAPTTKDEELNFPINDSLLVGGSTPAISYPTVDFLVAERSATNSVKSSSEDVTGIKESVEEILLKELEDMGFKQVDLNKEILRMNEYNLEQSVDDLCGVAEWDPILEELHEMGFADKEMNKILLKKNNGSIKRVVMDLIAGEKA